MGERAFDTDEGVAIGAELDVGADVEQLQPLIIPARTARRTMTIALYDRGNYESGKSKEIKTMSSRLVLLPQMSSATSSSVRQRSCNV